MKQKFHNLLLYLDSLHNILFHTAPTPHKPMKYETQNTKTTMAAGWQHMNLLQSTQMQLISV
jgi:hypothetical protein